MKSNELIKRIRVAIAPRGFLLPTALMVMVLLLMLGLGASTFILSNSLISGNSRQNIQTEYQSEGGIDSAWKYIKDLVEGTEPFLENQKLNTASLVNLDNTLTFSSTTNGETLAVSSSLVLPEATEIEVTTDDLDLGTPYSYSLLTGSAFIPIAVSKDYAANVACNEALSYNYTDLDNTSTTVNKSGYLYQFENLNDFPVTIKVLNTDAPPLTAGLAIISLPAAGLKNDGNNIDTKRWYAASTQDELNVDFCDTVSSPSSHMTCNVYDGDGVEMTDASISTTFGITNVCSGTPITTPITIPVAEKAVASSSKFYKSDTALVAITSEYTDKRNGRSSRGESEAIVRMKVDTVDSGSDIISIVREPELVSRS